jgi:hypothetical protein
VYRLETPTGNTFSIWPSSAWRISTGGEYTGDIYQITSNRKVIKNGIHMDVASIELDKFDVLKTFLKF